MTYYRMDAAIINVDGGGSIARTDIDVTIIMAGTYLYNVLI